MEKIIKLSEASVNSVVKIVKNNSKGLSKQRLLDLGLVNGTKIYVLRKSFGGDPTAYLIRDTCIALRKEESDKIEVIPWV